MDFLKTTLSLIGASWLALTPAMNAFETSSEQLDYNCNPICPCKCPGTTGPRGPQGPRGDKGDPGDPGLPAPVQTQTQSLVFINFLDDPSFASVSGGGETVFFGNQLNPQGADFGIVNLTFNIPHDFVGDSADISLHLLVQSADTSESIRLVVAYWYTNDGSSTSANYSGAVSTPPITISNAGTAAHPYSYYVATVTLPAAPPMFSPDGFLSLYIQREDDSEDLRVLLTSIDFIYQSATVTP